MPPVFPRVSNSAVLSPYALPVLPSGMSSHTTEDKVDLKENRLPSQQMSQTNTPYPRIAADPVSNE